MAAFAWGLVTGLSRPNGFLVSVPLALLAVADWRAICAARLRRRAAGASWHRRVGRARRRRPVFSAYLDSLTGHPLAWMEAHRAWGRVATDVAGLFTERADIIANQGFYVYSIGQPIELMNATLVIAALSWRC